MLPLIFLYLPKENTCSKNGSIVYLIKNEQGECMKQLKKDRKYEELYKELFDRNSKVTTICLLLCGVFLC